MRNQLSSTTATRATQSHDGLTIFTPRCQRSAIQLLWIERDCKIRHRLTDSGVALEGMDLLAWQRPVSTRADQKKAAVVSTLQRRFGTHRDDQRAREIDLERNAVQTRTADECPDAKFKPEITSVDMPLISIARLEKALNVAVLKTRISDVAMRVCADRRASSKKEDMGPKLGIKEATSNANHRSIETIRDQHRPDSESLVRLTVTRTRAIGSKNHLGQFRPLPLRAS